MHPIVDQARRLVDEFRRRGGPSHNADSAFDGREIRKLRRDLGMTQVEFSEAFGFSSASLRNWETGHRIPDSSSRILLGIIAQSPEQVKSMIDGLFMGSQINTEDVNEKQDATARPREFSMV